MGKGFYLKLALNNLKRHQKKFIPYFIAATIMISIYFMVVMIIYSPGLKDVPNHVALVQLFRIGFFTLCIFITSFMLYINGFLIKQRKKELGLYGILGLEKRHVGYVMLWENLIINGSALLTGIVSGSIFGWIIFMLLLKSINVTKNTYFAIPLQAFTFTIIYNAVLFLLIAIINLFQIRIANPIDLLKSEHQGEKKVRFVLPKTILGLLALGYAYYISLNVTNPLQAMNKFFFAVCLVIVATNVLFTTGSLFLLRLLKNNKKFYYKANNFISVAGMFHRMKQNAKGLANICILSSMVLVTVSTCVSLYLGQEDSLRVRHQNDFELLVSDQTTEEQFEKLDQFIKKTAEVSNVIIEEGAYRYYSDSATLIYEGQRFILPDEKLSYFEKAGKKAVTVFMMTLSDYNRVSKQKEILEEGQLLLLSNGEYKELKTFDISTVEESLSYTITKHITDSVFTNGKHRKAWEELYLVLADETSVTLLDGKLNPQYGIGRVGRVIFNIQGENEDCFNFGQMIAKQYGDIVKPIGIEDMYDSRYFGYSLNGGLLFMGAYFTIIFLCATVLIIYFKQISEGYDDKDRFETMQKVGMDDREVKRTINKQILIVFFLPLVGALLHVSMASNMIIRLLEVFWLYNVKLTVLCILGSCAIFTAVYCIVYRLTAKTYCKIVKW